MLYLPRFSFSTDTYLPEERIDVFKENMGLVFNTNRVLEVQHRFFGSMKSVLLNDLMIVESSSCGQVFERDRAKISLDNTDHILIQFYTQGSAAFFKEGTVHSSDDLLIFDTAQAATIVSTDFKNMTLVVPKRVLKEKAIFLEQLHAQAIPFASSFMARMFKSTVLEIYQNANRIELNTAKNLQNTLLELIFATLKSYQNIKIEFDVDLYSKGLIIKRFIDMNITDPDLNVNLILKKFKMSRATLYRIFPEKFGGINGYINEKRLKNIFKRLSIKTDGSETIASLAYEYGFSSITNFNRNFKRFYNFSPSEAPTYFQAFQQRQEGIVWHNWYKSL